MARYIDADKLKQQCWEFKNDVSRSAMAFAQGQINAAPTADVVEVCRCKDCKEFHRSDDKLAQHCKFYGAIVQEDDFCSYGERKEK